MERESTTQSQPPYASIGDRLIAQIVDGLVAFGVYFFVGLILAPRFGGATEGGFSLTGRPALLLMTIVGVILLAYFVVAETTRGATLGKLGHGNPDRNDHQRHLGAAASTR